MLRKELLDLAGARQLEVGDVTGYDDFIFSHTLKNGFFSFLGTYFDDLRPRVLIAPRIGAIGPPYRQ